MDFSSWKRKGDEFVKSLEKAGDEFERSIDPKHRKEMNKILYNLNHGIWLDTDDQRRTPPQGDMGGWGGTE